MHHGNRLLRKLVITLVASLAAGGGLWLTLRPHHPSQEEQEEILKAQAEVEDSVKCGHDYVPGTSAYVQCMLQLNAARTAQLEPRGALDILRVATRSRARSPVWGLGGCNNNARHVRSHDATLFGILVARYFDGPG